MDMNENTYEKDVLGIPATNEKDAKDIARETLQFLNKKGIRIGNATRYRDKNMFYVTVYYLKEDTYALRKKI